MAASGASLTPDDGSDGNDSASAPSEFLAEFLSAIMRRQYAEALKYCRLILQYEPHNATARGFHPLLLHKVAQGAQGAQGTQGAQGAGSASEAGSSGRQSADSCAELSLDSSPPSSRSASPAAAAAPHTNSHSSSSGSCSGRSSHRSSRSDSADLNGNPTHSAPSACTDAEDENDNAAGGDHSLLKGASLQQLRAQFACSTK